MKIVILGGDGFIGWPTALHLSARGNDIIIVDNLSRRAIDNELECESLTPIRSMEERISAWKEVTGRQIKFYNIDISLQYEELVEMFELERPDSLVHFAEQRAAPYSMKSSKHKRYTVNNNVNGTNNVLCAILDSGLDIHLVHLGTMGVYGYSSVGLKIPEGYLKIEIPVPKEGDKTSNGHVDEAASALPTGSESDSSSDDETASIHSNDSEYVPKDDNIPMEIYYPPRPGSVYHMTKVLDAQMFEYYNRNNRMRITDLHQGIVWGCSTPETLQDERLINRFDYDGDYGTVLNRLLMQAAIQHPLTVYGSGGQTRAFIHIRDSVRCIEIALSNPPKPADRVLIFNQITETHRVRDLAALINQLTGVPVGNIGNPRNEAAENDLVVENKQFLELGLKPTKLSEGLLYEITELASKFSDRCDVSRIAPCSFWLPSSTTKTV
eukprot:TRINITY_DN249_c0_g1_i2.p1 TRINITY_DN249_c0_g1~~TRINITY_DN249_c0_g1_i2.p1  ORF type:complete len:481 (-),score=120.21 TRINITY_DN249_c0_g1_i2:82-1398(-)